jgi:hypothetical protein
MNIPLYRVRLRFFIGRAEKVMVSRQKRVDWHMDHCVPCVDGADCRRLSSQLARKRSLKWHLNMAKRALEDCEKVLPA